jgi:MFS family permease
MKRVVAASSAGTAFEWYDFFIFGSLATTIQKVFFAGLDPTAGLVAALGLFAAGFAFRPLGALIFGVIGDRLGRKGAFLATVSLMGASTFLIGILPTYAQRGSSRPSFSSCCASSRASRSAANMAARPSMSRSTHLTISAA